MSVYSELSRLQTLEPNEKTNALFDELVQLTSCTHTGLSAGVLQESSIRRLARPLRRLAASGEYELEKYWAAGIATSSNPGQELQRFPYYGNYEDLVRLEYFTLSGVSRTSFHRILFVGSGPLPLTSILLARNYNLAVDNLDKCEEAIGLSKRVLKSLEVDGAVESIHADILAFDEIRKYDVVILSALAGANSKTGVIKHIHRRMRTGAFLILRTATGLRTLLYPQIPFEALAGLGLKAIVHPLNHVINSFIIARKESS